MSVLTGNLRATVGVFVVAGLVSAANATDPTGKYDSSCATCHQSGVLGSPRNGDTAAWAPRLKKGMPTLLEHTKNGYRNMPARGLCDTCSDADYIALIEMMSR